MWDGKHEKYKFLFALFITIVERERAILVESKIYENLHGIERERQHGLGKQFEKWKIRGKVDTRIEDNK